MKILFCQHNITIKEKDKLVHRPTIDLPLGILYMAAYLRGKDWPGEIEIYDARLSGLVNKLPNGDMVFGDLDDVIEKNIPLESAVDALIQLIDFHGDWIDPADV